MGVWDLVGSLIGGGAKLHLKLEVARIPAGGLLSGTVEIEAGRRPLDVEGVRVCLTRTAVRARDGSPTSEILQRTVVDAVVGSGLRLAARGRETVGFAIRVPPDVEPSDDETSYRVRVELSGPDGKSTRSQAPVRIVDTLAARPAADTILDRFPALRGEPEPAQLADALLQLRFDHLSTDPARDLVAISPRLVELFGHGDAAVRVAALDAWAELVDGRPGGEHLDALARAIGEVDGADEWVARAAEAAGRVGGAAAVPVLASLRDHAAVAVRRAVVAALTRLPPSTSGKAELLDQLAHDRDTAVRAAVHRAYGDYDDDAEVMARVAAHTTSEPSALVLEACVATLRGAFAHGHDEIARPVIERLSAHPVARVRAAVARTMGAGAGDLASRSLVDAFLSDAAAEVRVDAIGELRSLGPGSATFLGRLEQLATEDPAPEVRAAALATLPALVEPGQLSDYYRSVLDAEPPAEVVRGILAGIRQHRAPEFDDLLDELADHPDKTLAADARELLDAAS